MITVGERAREITGGRVQHVREKSFVEEPTKSGGCFFEFDTRNGLQYNKMDFSESITLSDLAGTEEYEEYNL